MVAVRTSEDGVVVLGSGMVVRAALGLLGILIAVVSGCAQAERGANVEERRSNQAKTQSWADRVQPRTLSDHGLSIELPPGWHGRIYRRPEDEITGLHVANFPLPSEDDDLASAARRGMADTGIVLGVIVGDTESPSWWTPATLPVEIRRSDFAPYEGFEWRTAAIRHLLIDKRSALVFAAFGSAHPRDEHLAEANAVLATVGIGATAAAEARTGGNAKARAWVVGGAGCGAAVQIRC